MSAWKAREQSALSVMMSLGAVPGAVCCRDYASVPEKAMFFGNFVQIGGG